MRALRAILTRVASTLASVALCISWVSNSGASTQQLTCAPASLGFFKVIVGQTATLPVTLTNSGATSVTVSNVQATPSVFSADNLTLPFSLAAGQSIQVSLTFAPTTTGSVTGTAVFTSNASNTQLSLPLKGLGVANWSLTANPGTIAFGKVQMGIRLEVPVALTNAGSSSVTISQRRLKGTGFHTNGITLPLTLSAGESYTFKVAFVPQTSGAVAGRLSLTGPLDPVLKIKLHGTGTPAGQLAVTPASLNFGNVLVGTRASQSGTLSASGASVTVSSASSSNSEFTLKGLSLPATIAAGQSLPFTVVFAPQSTGSASSTLSFTSNGGGSPTESVGGAGTLPTVYLSWKASTSANVVGYNIYRRFSSDRSYAKIDSILDGTVTSYTDASVVSGETYYYATKAVNSRGQESTFSNWVKVKIP
jgi:hypothetical protein